MTIRNQVAASGRWRIRAALGCLVRRRRGVTCLVAAVLITTASCLLPTEGCACPPAISAAVVAGTLTDADDHPVAGARVAFDGVPPTMSSEPPIWINEVGVTDASGRFVARASTWHYPGEMTIRAAVIRAGSSDTLVLRTGAVANFRSSYGPLDTVHIELRLPD